MDLIVSGWLTRIFPGFEKKTEAPNFAPVFSAPTGSFDEACKAVIVFAPSTPPTPPTRSIGIPESQRSPTSLGRRTRPQRVPGRRHRAEPGTGRSWRFHDIWRQVRMQARQWNASTRPIAKLRANVRVSQDASKKHHLTISGTEPWHDSNGRGRCFRQVATLSHSPCVLSHRRRLQHQAWPDDCRCDVTNIKPESPTRCK